MLHDPSRLARALGAINDQIAAPARALARVAEQITAPTRTVRAACRLDLPSPPVFSEILK